MKAHTAWQWSLGALLSFPCGGQGQCPLRAPGCDGSCSHSCHGARGKRVLGMKEEMRVSLLSIATRARVPGPSEPPAKGRHTPSASTPQVQQALVLSLGFGLPSGVACNCPTCSVLCPCTLPPLPTHAGPSGGACLVSPLLPKVCSRAQSAGKAHGRSPCGQWGSHAQQPCKSPRAAAGCLQVTQRTLCSGQDQLLSLHCPALEPSWRTGEIGRGGDCRARPRHSSWTVHSQAQAAPACSMAQARPHGPGPVATQVISSPFTAARRESALKNWRGCSCSGAAPGRCKGRAPHACPVPAPTGISSRAFVGAERGRDSVPTKPPSTGSIAQPRRHLSLQRMSPEVTKRPGRLATDTCSAPEEKRDC